jgi:hypothetical protein
MQYDKVVLYNFSTVLTVLTVLYCTVQYSTVYTVLFYTVFANLVNNLRAQERFLPGMKEGRVDGGKEGWMEGRKGGRVLVTSQTDSEPLAPA